MQSTTSNTPSFTATRKPTASASNTIKRVAITGGTGLIGTALTRLLRGAGAEVLCITRRAPRNPGVEVQWDPARGRLDPQRLEGVDAVVHLAGESAGSGPMGIPRWTAAQKERILESRRQGTRTLVDALGKMERKPEVLVSASGVGYYGTQCGEADVTEQSARGSGFLADVARVWEDEAQRATHAGVRVVNARFGVVLSGKGGALASMLLPFKLGLGGRIGSGRQYLSWVSLPDCVHALLFLAQCPDAKGAVNVCAPNPVTNADFARALGQTLRRPAVLPLPTPVVKLLFGEMGEETLLASQRARPAVLQQLGFHFMHPSIDVALKDLLGKDPDSVYSWTHVPRP